MHPQEVPMYETTKTLHASLSAMGSDAKFDCLMNQIEYSMDFDLTGDPASIESLLTLQIRMFNAFINRISFEGVRDGAPPDNDTVDRLIRLQKQCVATSDIINKRRNRIMHTQKNEKRTIDAWKDKIFK